LSVFADNGSYILQGNRYLMGFASNH